MIRPLMLVLLVPLLGGCIGDLPEEELPCLVATGQYNKYNEAYVFSPQGKKKREAMVLVKEAEANCELARPSPEPGDER